MDLSLLYSIVRKGHKIRAKEANGDYSLPLSLSLSHTHTRAALYLSFSHSFSLWFLLFVSIVYFFLSSAPFIQLLFLSLSLSVSFNTSDNIFFFCLFVWLFDCSSILLFTYHFLHHLALSYIPAVTCTDLVHHILILQTMLLVPAKIAPPTKKIAKQKNTIDAKGDIS